jgi:hypothetical protein
MKVEPEHFDVRIAGWWVWGQCLWIGSGWCESDDVPDKMPNLTAGTRRRYRREPRRRASWR